MAAPGERYSYSSGPGMNALAGVLTRATGKTLLEYANEKLFAPIGMTCAGWGTLGKSDYYGGGSGLQLTPRDMARFGYLYLNCGNWAGKQIIPAEWVAVTPPKSKAMQAYGYLFWNYPLEPFNSSFEANGAFGQYIEILPERDTVIIRTGAQSALDVWLTEIGSKLGLS